MKRTIACAASLLQLGYGVWLVIIGASGIVGAPWELATVFGIDPSAWPLAVRPTMLDQYRYLNSLELGAGVFCLVYRSAILAGERAALVFLAFVGMGICARIVSWLADGRPAGAFVIFMVLEIFVFIAVAWNLRMSHGRRRA